MRLFFETAQQALSFLAAVPVGFLIAAFLSIGSVGGFFRLAADIAVLLLGGVILVFLLAILGDNALRLHHLLGVLVGALLYLRGCYAFFYKCIKWYRQKRSRSGRN